MSARRLLFLLGLLSSCQIPFDLPAAGAGGANAVAGSGGADGLGGAAGASVVGGAAGALVAGAAGAAAATLLFDPVAAWTFEGSGRPERVRDRVGRVDLFPYPVVDANQTVLLENEALVLSGGNLKSDPDAGTELVRPLELGEEFSAEIWAEMAPAAFEGKRVLFKPTGGDLFNLNQFTTGASFEVPIPTAGDGAVVLGDHRGQPHHWVGTFSGSGRVVRLYLDGDLGSSRDLMDPIQYAAIRESRIEIGDQLWEGRVYWAAIYERELTALEVRALNEAGWQR